MQWETGKMLPILQGKYYNIILKFTPLVKIGILSKQGGKS